MRKLYADVICDLHGNSNFWGIRDRFQAMSKGWVTRFMVLGQPLVAHGVGGQELMTRGVWGGTVGQSR